MSCSGSPKVCTSTFTGKATVKAINRLTGVQTNLGQLMNSSISFQLDATDAGEPGSSPGSGPDSFAIRVYDANGTIMNLDSTPTDVYNGARSSQNLLNGGNLKITQ
jgi:hypothetical protein